MRRASIDPRLSARITGVRPLVYTHDAHPDDDRPPHVRAASGIACDGRRLVVIQDDASFLATLEPDGTVHAIALPFGPNRRRRFEVALGNKLDKLDLESCVCVGDDEVWAFGSGSLPVRENIARLRGREASLVDASPLYRALRDALVRSARGRPAEGATSNILNLEGAAVVGDELWLCHRGNSGPSDGPAIARLALAGLRALLEGGDAPTIRAIDRYDLGRIGGSPLGFTDAAVRDGRVFYVAAAEASPDAIDDGAVLGSQLGVIDEAGVRAAPLVGLDGRPVKVEGLAFVGDRIVVTLDPDDPAQPTPLCEVQLDGPW